jgi:glutamine amidotransferase
VGDDTNTFLAHNGVLDTFISKGDKRSDTRVFAEDTLPKLGGVLALEDENIYRMIEGWASGSKIAVLTTNPQAQYQLYLINERLGTWDDNGVWWSNSSYKRTIVTPRSYYNPAPNPIADTGAFTEADFADEQAYYAELQSQLDSYAIIDECPMCEALIDIEVSADYCQYCEACVSCGAHHYDCMCYTPHSTKSKTRELDFDNQWVRVYNKEQQALPY